MSNFANERKTRTNPSLQWTTRVSDHTEVTLLIYSLEAITRIGKNFPIIFLSLASLNILLAANDFLANSFEFGILNSAFAFSGIITMMQMRHNNNKINPSGLSYNEAYRKSFMDNRK